MNRKLAISRDGVCLFWISRIDQEDYKTNIIACRIPRTDSQDLDFIDQKSADKILVGATAFSFCRGSELFMISCKISGSSFKLFCFRNSRIIVLVDTGVIEGQRKINRVLKEQNYTYQSVGLNLKGKRLALIWKGYRPDKTTGEMVPELLVRFLELKL